MDDNNEPAFPVTFTDRSGQIGPTYSGMTLRDWFAGMALMGISSRPVDCSLPSLAEMAYKRADAMIAKRNKE